MNKIEQLLAQLCPEGVEFRQLGKCISANMGGGTPSKAVDDYWEGEIPWASVGDLSIPGNIVSSTRSHITKKGLKNSATKLIEKGNVIVAIKISPGRMKVTGCDIAINQDIRGLKLKQCIDAHFLTYYFQTLKIVGNGTIVKSITSSELENIKIPIPPLAIQNKIVKILDKFVELQAELQAELQNRKLQYEYYRNALLTFPNSEQRTANSEQRTANSEQRTANSEQRVFPWLQQLLDKYCPEGIEFKELKEIGVIFSGLSGKKKSDFINGNAKFISYLNVLNNISINLDVANFVKINQNETQKSIEYGDIIFTESSETANEVAMSSVMTKRINELIYLNSFCIGFRLNNQEKLIPDFSKHLFRSEGIRNQLVKTASGVTRFNVSKKRLEKIKIPIPPLPVQQKIVAILDTFDALVNDLTIGLPAEIRARRIQYEYYRNQLLSFNSMVNK